MISTCQSQISKYFVRAPNGSGYTLQVLVPQNTGGTAGFPLLSLTRVALKDVSLYFRYVLLLILAANCKERYRPNIARPDKGFSHLPNFRIVLNWLPDIRTGKNGSTWAISKALTYRANTRKLCRHLRQRTKPVAITSFLK